MAVRIGKIELTGLSRIQTEDTRRLVKQRGPGESGGLFQDLGREPITIVMEGILLGDDTQSALEDLRQAHAKAKPMSFAADAIVGTDLTHVLIADLQARQLAGHVNRYAFFLRVREHTEPAESPAAGAAATDTAAKADAATWHKGAVDAAAVKQNPSALMTKLDENPALVAHLSGDELGDLAHQNADRMSGGDFGKLLGTVGQVNPSAVDGMVNKLKAKGTFAQFMEKLSQGCASLISFVKKIKLDTVIALFKTIIGGAEFLRALKEVYEKAKIVASRLGGLDLKGVLDEVDAAWSERDWPASVEDKIQDESEASATSTRSKTVTDLLKAITDLIKAIDALVQTDSFKGLVDLAKSLSIGKLAVSILDGICAAMDQVIGWLATLEQIAAIPRITRLLIVSLEDIKEMTDMSTSKRQQKLEEIGWGQVVPIAKGANAVATLFIRLHNVSRRLGANGDLERRTGELGKSLTGLKQTFEGHLPALGQPVGATA